MNYLSEKAAPLTQFAHPLSLRKPLDLSHNSLKHKKLQEDVAAITALQISGGFINVHKMNALLKWAALSSLNISKIKAALFGKCSRLRTITHYANSRF